jgi:uncharacterized membrane protein
MGVTRAALVAALALAPAALAGKPPPAAPPIYVAAPAEGLTVRASPDGAPIGDLAAGAQPIEISAVDDSGAWGRIIYGESDGWIELARASTVEVPLLAIAPIPAGLVCAGNEPFWSLRFADEKANFVEPGVEPVGFELSRPATAAGTAGWPLSVTLVGGEASGVALLRPQACTDGMSDRSHPWTLDFLSQREGAPLLLTGCCRVPIAP